jgi:hypothetical protein
MLSVSIPVHRMVGYPPLAYHPRLLTALEDFAKENYAATIGLPVLSAIMLRAAGSR